MVSLLYLYSLTVAPRDVEVALIKLSVPSELHVRLVSPVYLQLRTRVSWRPLLDSPRDD